MRPLFRPAAAPMMLVLLLVACGSASPPAAPSASAATTAALTRYVDSATGIAFMAPAGLFVTPSVAAPGGTTTQAIFSTYDRATTAPRDLTNELVLTASIASRAANEDLRAFAARNAQGVSYGVTDLPKLGGIVIAGTFQTGARRYALIPQGPTAVLIVDAFPSTSSRIAIFDAVLATLEVK